MKKRTYLTSLVAIAVFSLGCAGTIDTGKSSGVQDVPLITGIDIQDYELKITVNKPFRSVFRSIDPHKVVVELPDVSIGAFNNRIVSDKAGITEIIPSQTESPSLMARLDISVQTPAIFSPEYRDNTLIIRIKKLESAVPLSD